MSDIKARKKRRIKERRQRDICNLVRLILTITAVFLLLVAVCTIKSIESRLNSLEKAQIDMLNTMQWHRLETEEVLQEEPEKPKLTSLGMFEITAYCPCEICCVVSTGITATGTIAKPNHTIAVDPEVIPYGTVVLIDGFEYVAEDKGGAIKGNRIDIFFDSHQEALNWGVKEIEVFKIV